jgi:hypothetical protein
VMPWGMTISSNPARETGLCEATFDARIYEPARVRGLMDAYAAFVREASLNPEKSLERLLV